MDPSVGYCKDDVFPGLRITAAIRITEPEREIAAIGLLCQRGIKVAKK